MAFNSYSIGLSSTGKHFTKKGNSGTGRFLMAVISTDPELTDIASIFVTASGYIYIHPFNNGTLNLTYTEDSDHSGFAVSHSSKTNTVSVVFLTFNRAMWFEPD